MTIERFDDGGADAEMTRFDQEPATAVDAGDRDGGQANDAAGTQVTKPPDRWREVVILAQDPSVTFGGRALRASVRVPREDLMPGPRGHRFQVVDFDATRPRKLVSYDLRDDAQAALLLLDDKELVESHVFRAQNVYAIASRTLDAFEQALGRRVPWSHAGHQLFLVPTAFREANAFYDPDSHAVFFGYFDLPDGTWAYTSLSHDIVAHETTHAVLDGLRSRFQEPGLPDQAAFHEAFADIVALLSVFSMPDVVETILSNGDALERLVPADRLTIEALSDSPLLGLGEQLGQALGSYGTAQRGAALRRSVELKPGKGWIDDPDWEEPHLRGEILVAAVTKTFVAMWAQRLDKLRGDGKRVDRDIATEEGAKAADHLLRMAIRAIDYSPPLEFTFADFLDAVLVSDAEIAPDDEHDYRGALRASFGAFGIEQPPGQITVVGTPGKGLRYSALHADELRTSPDEVYRFIWDNVGLLGIPTDQYLEVDSIWSSTRVGPDGFVVREVVATYVQMLEATVRELGPIASARGGSFRRPVGIDPATPAKLFGGGALIFDQWGRPKYHQSKPLFDWARQADRLGYLARSGQRDRQQRLGYSTGLPDGLRFAVLHAPGINLEEAW
jgi:hypothetical protein